MPTHMAVPDTNLFLGATYPADCAIFKAPLSTILLAEDNDDLREVLTYFLETLSFHVVACRDAEAASAAFHSHPSVEILITDVQMPGRSGIELARELTILRPSLPVLIMSGSILPHMLLEEIRISGWSFRSKPCRLDALVTLINSLLHLKPALAA